MQKIWAEKLKRSIDILKGVNKKDDEELYET